MRLSWRSRRVLSSWVDGGGSGGNCRAESQSNIGNFEESAGSRLVGSESLCEPSLEG